ncbi:MAG: hypothetical protein QXQ11_08995 [Candidatus Bathyarchaeia archaeon]
MYETLLEFKQRLSEAVRASFEDYEQQIIAEIKHLNKRIDALEARILELEEDRIHKLIQTEAQNLGVSEEELLKMVAEYIKKKLKLKT